MFSQRLTTGGSAGSKGSDARPAIDEREGASGHASSTVGADSEPSGILIGIAMLCMNQQLGRTFKRNVDL